MSKTTFGSFVRKLRLAKGLGLRSFAKVVEILPSNLSNIECGKANPPRAPEILKRIASALGLSDKDQDYGKLFDLATKEGEISADVQEYFEEIEAMEELPLMARTIKNEKLTKEQIRQLIRDIKGT
ncbi:MAG TPA: helix-turn-helix transcriptional regulator [Candidatus Omnitrophota bacterium]|nr:helix-turn-helix transcriptional regulator [Candidatus Omnitrophota bacterium]